MKERFELRLDRFDKMRENNPTSEAANDQDSLYKEAGHTRNVCFVLPDGKQQFFNYAYLVSVLFDPGADNNVIMLEFTSHTLTLKGYRLEMLYMDFFDHFPRIVTATGPRYAATHPDGAVVKEILIEKNGE